MHTCPSLSTHQSVAPRGRPLLLQHIQKPRDLALDVVPHLNVSIVGWPYGVVYEADGAEGRVPKGRCAYVPRPLHMYA